jgi:O-methyltransferase involved in polyketide biosynthesis
MTENEHCYPVSDTAALVMLWASAYYEREPLIGAYIRKLDLSAGRQLLERYNSICPWYPEVIVNRKHFIKNTVEDLIKDDRKPTIIVNLGAGFSPLALELSPLLGENIRFIEIDRSNMCQKHRLYAGLVHGQSRFISCIEADITDTACLKEVLGKETGGPAPARLIVIMEGLSYYIDKPAMMRVLACLSALAPDMSIVFEHLKPCRLVSEERRFIPDRIFSDVRDYTALERMTTYSEDEIRAILGSDFSCSYSNMDEMEKRRTGGHRYFPTPGSGWLSCAVAVRRPGDQDG